MGRGGFIPLGRRLVVLSVLVLSVVAPRAAAVVPGGNGKIAFSSDEGTFTRKVLTIEPDGAQRTRIVDPGDQPAWSPDGTKIAYTSPAANFNQGPQLVIVNADGSGTTTPTDTVQSEFEPTWSPDGAKIAFTRHVPRSGGFLAFEIFAMNVDGSNQVQLTHSLEDGLGFEAFEPAWSPDGTKIAFTREIAQSGSEPLDAEIYVMDADGSNLRRLTHNPATSTGPNDLGPAWSPDGSHIAFSSQREGRYGVYVMNGDGSGLRRLADGPAGSWPAWSPDGTRIAYASPSHDIRTINVGGGDIRNVTSTPGISELSPDWQRVNRGPDCSAVRATPSSLGAPNHRLVPVTVAGATDPDGDVVTLEITGVTQDEPVDRPDAVGTPAPDQVQLRADRDPHGDGRIYRIAFTADDGHGSSCTGVATASVRKGNMAIDSAPPSYDSFGS